MAQQLLFIKIWLNLSLSNIMPFQFIGSTGVLRPGQCQNDIWITQGDPNFPVLGDARVILQATNPTTGIIYRELWNPVANAWQVWPMLPPLRAINASLNPNIPLLPVVIANNQITNQFRGAAIVSVSLEHHILFGCQYCRSPAILHSACKSSGSRDLP